MDCCKIKKILKNGKTYMSLVLREMLQVYAAVRQERRSKTSICRACLKQRGPAPIQISPTRLVCRDTRKIKSHLFSSTKCCSHSQLFWGDGKVGHLFTPWPLGGQSTVWTWTTHDFQSPKSSPKLLRICANNLHDHVKPYLLSTAPCLSREVHNSDKSISRQSFTTAVLFN